MSFLSLLEVFNGNESQNRSIAKYLDVTKKFGLSELYYCSSSFFLNREGTWSCSPSTCHLPLPRPTVNCHVSVCSCPPHPQQCLFILSQWLPILCHWERSFLSHNLKLICNCDHPYLFSLYLTHAFFNSLIYPCTYLTFTGYFYVSDTVLGAANRSGRQTRPQRTGPERRHFSSPRWWRCLRPSWSCILTPQECALSIWVLLMYLQIIPLTLLNFSHQNVGFLLS